MPDHRVIMAFIQGRYGELWFCITAGLLTNGDDLKSSTVTPLISPYKSLLVFYFLMTF